ncbi:MAG: hypothetical protein HZC42_05980 [Candidatus Eisenbacteria bacterium]|nr:hypothetical protein [Candidatus Eisenbacteria bacterium]
MKLDPAKLLGPLVALIVLVLILQQTTSALRASGTWSRGETAAAAPDPYAPLESLIARRDASPVLRDPFSFARVAAPATAQRPQQKPKPVAVALARPVLTAIVWDNDPRATVRWSDRDFTVRAGSLFDDFRVVSITRDQVVLERGGETIALQLPRRKGE